MVFTHDTDAALLCTAALINTAPGSTGTDALADVTQLAAFLDAHRMTGRRDGDATELHAVRRLRPRLRALWVADEDDAVTGINELLAHARALPQLVTHDGWGYHLHATAADAPVAVRLGVEAAMAFVDLVRAAELDRLGVCAAEGCDHVIVDLSKNRSRRYCDAGCANRIHAAAYRARRPPA